MRLRGGSRWVWLAVVLLACSEPVDPASQSPDGVEPVTDVVPGEDLVPSTDGHDDLDADPVPEVEGPPWPLPEEGAIRACFQDPACSDRFVVAHRGLVENGSPENSLTSIRRAARAGVPMVEIDIRTTADGVLFLMHDTTLRRTTGLDAEVRESTWAEIQALTLIGGDPDDPESLEVPSFARALAVAREEGVALYLDIKDADPAAIVEAVRDAEWMDQSLFRRGVASLEGIRAVAPEAWVLAPIDSLEDAREAAQRLSPLRVVEVTRPAADPDLVAALIEEGLVVQQDVMAGGDAVWIITGRTSGWESFVDAGVRLLQTDLPVELMAFLANR